MLHSKWKREISLEYLTYEEIGKLYGLTRGTIGRHIYLDLRHQQEEMEVLAHE